MLRTDSKAANGFSCCVGLEDEEEDKAGGGMGGDDIEGEVFGTCLPADYLPT